MARPTSHLQGTPLDSKIDEQEYSESHSYQEVYYETGE